MRVNFNEIKKVYLLAKGEHSTMSFVYAELNDGTIHHVFMPNLAMDEEEDILSVEPLNVRDILTGEKGRKYNPGGVKVHSRLNKMTRAGYTEFVKRYTAQYE